jgi:hypothetical protein
MYNYLRRKEWKTLVRCLWRTKSEWRRYAIIKRWINYLQKNSTEFAELIEAREFWMAVFHFPKWIPTSNYPLGMTTRILTQSRDAIDNTLIDALPFCALPSRFDLVLTEFEISTFLSFIAIVSDSLIYILQLKFCMKAAVDAQIVRSRLKVSAGMRSMCVSALVPTEFHEFSFAFETITPWHAFRLVIYQRKLPQILDLIDVRTLQSACLSLTDLLSEVQSRFGTSINDSTVRAIRNNLGFHSQAARHLQNFWDHEIEAPVEFCWKMLAHPEEFECIHLFNESRFIIGD